MKKMKMMSMLLAAAMTAGMLTACGGSTSESTESTAAASETAAETGETTADAGETTDAAQTDYAYLNNESGFCVKKWTGTYAQLDERDDVYLIAESGTTTIDSIYMGIVYVVYPELPEDFDITAEGAAEEAQKYYSVLTMEPVLFSEDADLTEDELKALIEQSDNEIFSTDYTLTAFKTGDGHNLYQLGGIGEGAEYSEYATDDTKKTFEALESEWETQRAQFEIVNYQGSTNITFSATDYDGNSVDESIFKNAKVTMVNIWGISCNPCIREMPDLRKLNDNIDDFQVVTVLSDVTSLSDTDGIDEAHEIMQTQGADTLPVILMTDELYTIFPYTGTPTSYLVDSNGNILGRPHAGSYNEGNYEMLEQWVKDTMAEM